MRPEIAPDQLASDKVFTYFRERLLDGTLAVGERLAGERELSLALGISRPVLREALRSLAMFGFLDIRHGKGAYVKAADVSVLSDFFAFCLAQQPDILDDVMQARIAIECQAIRLACERGNDGDLARISGNLTRLMDTIHDPVRGGEADFDFHQAIVAASHSASLVTLYQAISDPLHRSHIQRRSQTISIPGIVDYLVDAHREVFVAIAERDPDKADQRLREHFAIGDEFRRKSYIAAFSTTEKK
jgi:DNA-binding FadR family transcriptional regulator